MKEQKAPRVGVPWLLPNSLRGCARLKRRENFALRKLLKKFDQNFPLSLFRRRRIIIHAKRIIILP